MYYLWTFNFKFGSKRGSEGVYSLELKKYQKLLGLNTDFSWKVWLILYFQLVVIIFLSLNNNTENLNHSYNKNKTF